MAKGDCGEHYLAYRVIKDFGWPCRILDIDIGIDAQIEIIDSESNVTGQFIGVQVKTSDKPKITEAHLKYWRECEFPVIIVHVNTENGEMHYRHVDKNSPPNKFRNINHYYSFDKESKEELISLIFHDEIDAIKKSLSEIKRSILKVKNDLNSEPRLIDQSDCNDFIDDFYIYRGQLVECKTSLLSIYKTVGDCDYRNTCELYLETKDKIISYKRKLQCDEYDIQIINAFEKVSTFDSILKLPTDV